MNHNSSPWATAAASNYRQLFGSASTPVAAVGFQPTAAFFNTTTAAMAYGQFAVGGPNNTAIPNPRTFPLYSSQNYSKCL